MKYTKLFKFILIVIILFFSLHLTSHIFLKHGLNKETPPRSGLLKVSIAIFPLDAEIIYEYAFAMLEEQAYLKGSGRLKFNESVKSFKRAIQLNPLLYNAHFNLAKAYQLNQNGETTLYDDVLKYLKRAAYIRGNLAHISVEVIKQFLSLWPFLNHEDKEFCQHLLVKSIPGMSNADFTAILNVWGIYSKDIEMLRKALVKKPQFYREISKKLEQLELDLKARQEFLSRYEVYYMEYFRKRFPGYLNKSKDHLKTTGSWYDRLRNTIPGYLNLVKNSNFNLSIYRELKKDLIIKIIDLLIREKNLSNKDEDRNKLGETILTYINDCDTRENINQIYQFLKTKNFFNRPDLKNLFLETLIHSKMDDWNQVIQKGEEIRQSMSFVREDQKEDYTKILMLLVEGYLITGQINRVEAILQEVEKISPESEELIWLRCKMERRQEIEERKSEARNPKSEIREKKEEIGERRQEIEERKSQARNPKSETSTNDQNTNDQNLRKEIGDRRQKSEGKEEKTKQSRVIDLRSTRLKKTIYFKDESVIIIKLGEKFREKIKDKHLLQVFVDGWIYFEQYLSKVKEEVEVKVKEGEWKKVEVEVRVR